MVRILARVHFRVDLRIHPSQTNAQPAISSRDNLKMMALVEAAYLSASSFKSVGMDEAARPGVAPRLDHAEKRPGFFSRLFSTPSVLSGTRSGSPDFRNFTPCAQQLLGFARGEAGRLRQNFVATEHLLPGLLSLGQGVAVNVLKAHVVDFAKVRQEVES